MMIHRTPHQDHSSVRPRSRTSSGNYNTNGSTTSSKPTQSHDEPTSPSKTVPHPHLHHHSTGTATSNTSVSGKNGNLPTIIKKFTRWVVFGLFLLFLTFIVWNVYTMSNKELFQFRIHDSYESTPGSHHYSQHYQRGKRGSTETWKDATSGGMNGGGSNGFTNHFTSKYVEILTRNWLLQQFKYLQKDYASPSSVTTDGTDRLVVTKHTTSSITTTSATDHHDYSQVLLVQPNTLINLTAHYDPFDFQRNQGVNLWDLFPPIMNCPDLQRIGKVGEGGKWICGLSYLQSSFTVEKPCIIYSFGINDDISFEIELLLKTDCIIYGFDPTIGQLPINSHQINSQFVRGVHPDDELSIEELQQRFHFEKIALNDFTGSDEQFLWNEALYDIMKRHKHTFINLLKVDIEGNEWKIFSSLFQQTPSLSIRQPPSPSSTDVEASRLSGTSRTGATNNLPVGEILIELHYDTLPTTIEFFSGLYATQFYSVSREINLIPTLNAQKPFAAEYTFINVNNFYGVHPPASDFKQLQQSHQGELGSEAASFLRSTPSPSLSNTSVALPYSTLRKVKGLIYFLTQRSRLPKMCEALRLLHQNFYQFYPHYPVFIFHDDYSGSDEDYLQRKCSTSFTPSSEQSASSKMKEFAAPPPPLKLRFVRIDFKIPKHLTKRNIFIPKRTFCDPSHSSIGYRHMCRFHGFAVHKELSKQVKELFKSSHNDYYIWRLDDDSLITAPIGYDIFQFMQMNEKLYGFISLIKDDAKCVMGLWETSRRFFSNITAASVRGSLGSHYNYSQSLLSQWPDPIVFYNNFEISHSSIWKHPLWTQFRDYLDWLGGIFTLRWGDAPIHTIIITAILSRQQIHKFSDVGYTHNPFLKQKAKGLPMPGMDPFLLLPVECHYFKEWNCVISSEGNSSANFSFASTAMRDQFLQSVSIVKNQRPSTQRLVGKEILSIDSSLPSLPNKEKGVIFTFGEVHREELLSKTITNFYFQFARRFHIPFVVFYDRHSSFNESKVTKALSSILFQPEGSSLSLLFHPVILPNITSSAPSAIKKNLACWWNRHDQELSVSLFLQKQAFDILLLLGYQWFFRIPDAAKLLSPILANPFSKLEQEGKKYGFILQTSLPPSPCMESLIHFTEEFCHEIDLLSTQMTDSFTPMNSPSGDLFGSIPILPRCSSFFRKEWDKNTLMMTSLAISHSSVWESIFASFIFDITHPRAFGASVSEDLLASLNSSSTSSSSSRPSQYHSLLLLLERLKSSDNPIARSLVMNWGDSILHNIIVFISLSSQEVIKLSNIYSSVSYTDSPGEGATRNSSSASSATVVVIRDRNAEHLAEVADQWNELFTPQPYGWLGGDVAVSIPFPNIHLSPSKEKILLPPNKLLWLFGDTLLGMSSPERRIKDFAKMVDNSVAITTFFPEEDEQTGGTDCAKRSASPWRKIADHQFYYQRRTKAASSSTSKIVGSKSIFQLVSLQMREETGVGNEDELRIWPISGLFAFDEEKQLRLLVIADISFQKPQSASDSTVSTSPTDIFSAKSLDFDLKQQVLFRVNNPLENPENWLLDVIPLKILTQKLSQSTFDQHYAWIAMAESQGKYYADIEDSIYIFSSSVQRSTGKSGHEKAETSSVSHGLFRISARDLLRLDLSRLELFSTSSAVTADRSASEIVGWRQASTEARMKDLFASIQQFLPNYMMNEVSLNYDHDRKEWVVFHVNSLSLHSSYLYCTLPAAQLRGTQTDGFICEYLANIGQKWMHPSILTYAGHLHPHLLHSSLNSLQMEAVQRNKNCLVSKDGTVMKRRIVVSHVSNAMESLDILFTPARPSRNGEETGLDEAARKGEEAVAPSSKEIYVPQFIYLIEK